MIKEISVSGFRGFGISQTVQFAIPKDSKPGSGLTIITGANNSGKTTIIESIRAFNSSESPSFSEGRRNVQTGGKIDLKLVDDLDNLYSITSVDGGGSSTEKSADKPFHHYILQSRRAVPFEFSKTQWDKEQYISYSQKLDSQRTSSLDNFSARIFQIEENKAEFNALITKILGSDFQWTVEQRDSGNYYIKYTKDGIMHSSEGVGDGIWSIFTMDLSRKVQQKNSPKICRTKQYQSEGAKRVRTDIARRDQAARSSSMLRHTAGGRPSGLAV